MWVLSASSECHQCIKSIIDGLEEMQQIKDDIVLHEKGTEHDCRLKALFKWFQEYHITLWKEKCQLGITEVKWFGHIYYKCGMSAEPLKVEVIRAWPKPKDKTEVK